VLSDNLAASLFLTVDAYHSKEYSAIGFYKKCDFVQSEVAHDRYPDRAITTRMYKAITYDEKLIKYLFLFRCLASVLKHVYMYRLTRIYVFVNRYIRVFREVFE
jgi:hypothetical protein